MDISMNDVVVVSLTTKGKNKYQKFVGKKRKEMMKLIPKSPLESEHDYRSYINEILYNRYYDTNYYDNKIYLQMKELFEIFDKDIFEYLEDGKIELAKDYTKYKEKIDRLTKPN